MNFLATMQSATLSVRPSSVPLTKTPKLTPLRSQIKLHALSFNATRPPLSIKNGRLGLSAVVRAASESGAGAGDVKVEEAKEGAGSLMKTLQLGSLFGLWYLFNIYFNIYNKQVFIIFPCSKFRSTYMR